MKKIKRIFTAFLGAITISTAIVTPAFAEATSVESGELVDINGYQCQLIDGNYVTEINGEKYIVIDLGNIGSGNSTTFHSEASPLSNTTVVDVRDGKEHKESVNLNLGDYESPEFIVAPNKTELSAYIWTGFWVPQSYYVEISTYTYETGWGSERPMTLIFGNGYKYLFTGTASRLIKRFQLVIFADESNSLIKSFIYWVGTIEKTNSN